MCVLQPPAPSAQLASAGWAQAAGRSRSPGEAAGSADATGNTAVGRQAQLELNVMPWTKYISVFSLGQHFFMLLCFLFLSQVSVLVEGRDRHHWTDR